MAHAHAHVGGHGHAVTIDALPGDIFLEVFAFCISDPYMDSLRHTKEWQRLVHVCQRWRQIIYASPRYLDLVLWCSEATPVRNLNCWPEFPIAINYHFFYDEDDVVTLLKHHDRVCFVNLTIKSLRFGKVAAAMEAPFPVLTHLKLHIVEVRKDIRYGQAVLPSGFLGGSTPCLQRVLLSVIHFPTFPTFLLSSRNLVYLRLDDIPGTRYVSPEAMVAGLSVLTRLKTLHIHFHFPTEQRTRHSDPPLQAVLPALTELEFEGLSEYLEDFLALLDAPRLDVIRMDLNQHHSLHLPQLSLFITRTKNLRFRHAQVVFNFVDVEIKLDQFNPSHGVLVPGRPHFSLCGPLLWPGTHVEHVSHVLSQLFAMFSNLSHVFIHASDDHPGWQDDIGSTEWLAFLRLFTTVETLHVSGRLAGLVDLALEDIPEEMVTEVLPSLHQLGFEDRVESTSTGRFMSLRQLYGHPVTIVDLDSGG